MTLLISYQKALDFVRTLNESQLRHLRKMLDMHNAEDVQEDLVESEKVDIAQRLSQVCNFAILARCLK